ncbi:molecular chaperone [Pseudomonas sp. p50]|uniref:fimbrial biogenesis chaperone n=1 Tax=Pseudomonas sp. p50(2008) TaxID=2816832 RepID=UPI00188D54EE|nr:molecular chaperone [Pseudomonas sp. p50(2008)]MBF4557647.1 molecular chaperone [Pseudomonas sp. p50(2008)]
MFGLLKQAATARPILHACVAGLMLVAHIPVSQAALTINGTRVVYDSDKRSVALRVNNPGDSTFAAQTWVNTAADDTSTAVPFIVTPPLFRINPGKQQQVQINGLPNDLPNDRESLFYFNLQEIPQATAGHENVLNIALRTRIKLFYRPSELKDNPIARLKDLQWSIQTLDGKAQLVVNNPTPFHVSFARLEVKGSSQYQRFQSASMVDPLSTQTYALENIKPGSGLQVEFSAINDYGGYSTPVTLPIQLTP